MSLLEPELRPSFALGDAGVDVFFDNGGAYAAGGFDTFAVVIETVRYDCFGTILVRGYNLRWKSCGIVKVVFDVVGPVWTANRMLEKVVITKEIWR